MTTLTEYSRGHVIRLTRQKCYDRLTQQGCKQKRRSFQNMQIWLVTLQQRQLFMAYASAELETS